MIAFLRRIWMFVKPYQSRLVLGLLCGILYAVANAAFVIAGKLVIDLVFPATRSGTLANELARAPKFARPLV